MLALGMGSVRPERGGRRNVLSLLLRSPDEYPVYRYCPELYIQGTSFIPAGATTGVASICSSFSIYWLFARRKVPWHVCAPPFVHGVIWLAAKYLFMGPASAYASDELYGAFYVSVGVCGYNI